MRRMPPGAADHAPLQQLDARTLLGRCMTPEEIADGPAFLASDDRRMITGHSFVVDAGTLMQ